MKPVFKKSRSWYLGTAFILLSVVGLLFTYLPLVTLYLIPSPPPRRIDSSFFISISSIHAYAPIIADVDPWDEKMYTDALKRGVAHAKGFSRPGEQGSVFLFAHSSLPPWEMTRTNSAFLHLSKLQKNDEILIYFKGKKYVYSVVSKKEVIPSDINAVLTDKYGQLILQTCTPIGTDFRRILVFAELVT